MRLPIEGFSYIVGGFSNTIVTQLKEIITASRVNGSATPVSVFIKMAEKIQLTRIITKKLKTFFH